MSEATQAELNFTRAEQLNILRRLPSVLDTDSNEVSKRSIVAVLRAIDEYANSGTGWCWASTVTIAGFAMVSERTVRRAMRWLDNAGLITCKIRGNGMTKMTKIIWGNMDDLFEADRPVATPDRPVLAAISGEHPVQDPKEHPVAVRDENFGLVQVDRQRVREVAQQIRDVTKCGPSDISTQLIVDAAALSVGTDWNALDVARVIGRGGARKPQSYLRGAIERARLERGGVIVKIKPETECIK